MKSRYFLTLLIASGMMNLVLAQSSNENVLQSMAKDTSLLTEPTGKQVNVTLPATDGISVDATSTLLPYYGYSISGAAKAYSLFNGSANQFEYHQSSDATPDFYINGTTKAVFNTSFFGIGTGTPTTGSATGFAMKSSVNGWYGMYVDAGPTGLPFYGYALNGVPVAYTQFNGTTSQLEYYHTNGSTPDFLISSTNAAFPATNFFGIGTTTPTTGFTGLALKSSANTWYGMYIDAGTTGLPFYGYALNGVARAYTQFNSASNQFEYHQTSDVTPDFYINGNTKAVFNSAFVGINTATPTTGADGFTMKSSANGYYGMYVDAGLTGLPFYGYALNGVAKAWTDLNGINDNWELYYNGTQISVSSLGNVGLGTSTPSQKLDVNGSIHVSGRIGIKTDPYYDLQINSSDYTAGYITTPYPGCTAFEVIATATTSGTWGLYSYATTAGYAAYFSGNVYCSGTYLPSDEKLKENIQPLQNGLDKIMMLDVKTYNFKTAEFPELNLPNNMQHGFTAQNLESVFPELVRLNPVKKEQPVEFKAVNYTGLIPVLTEAIQEQQKIIDQLKERIEILEENKK